MAGQDEPIQADNQVSQPDAKRRVWLTGKWFPIIPAILAFLAGIGGSVLGGLFAYSSAMATETSHEASDRTSVTETKRGDVYLAYLDAANKYALASQKLADDTARIGKGVSATDVYNNDYGPWLAARSSFQGEVNQVYVYGSDDAWAANRRVAAALPASLGPDNVTEFTQALTGVNWQNFDAAYDGFLTVVCREVPAEPRTGC